MLRTNWCRSCGGGHNFGDQLTPALLDHYGVKHQWAPPGGADLVAVGSILSKVPDGWRGTVLGTGFIRAGLKKNLTRARVLALRGPLTAKACRLPQGWDPTYGDLGLLSDRLLPADAARGTRPVGVLPHHIDYDLHNLFPDEYLIDVHLPPAEVVAAIASCERIVTSSLHGLIAADALGIPHIWAKHPGVIGDGFKFRDYAGAFRLEIEPEKQRLTGRRKMFQAQERLEELVALL